MADILEDLYQGYEDSLSTRTYRQSNLIGGEDLSWLRYAGCPGQIDLTSLWGMLPCLLYFWRETPFEKNTGEGSCRHDDKLYYFEFNCIFETQDLSYMANAPKIREHAANFMQLETVYNRNTLGVSAASWFTRTWQGSPTFPGFTMQDGIDWIFSINATIAHQWRDRRPS